VFSIKLWMDVVSSRKSFGIHAVLNISCTTFSKSLPARTHRINPSLVTLSSFMISGANQPRRGHGPGHEAVRCAETILGPP
jgi:hypothetical protein